MISLLLVFLKAGDSCLPPAAKPISESSHVVQVLKQFWPEPLNSKQEEFLFSENVKIEDLNFIRQFKKELNITDLGFLSKFFIELIPIDQAIARREKFIADKKNPFPFLNELQNKKGYPSVILNWYEFKKEVESKFAADNVSHYRENWSGLEEERKNQLLLEAVEGKCANFVFEHWEDKAITLKTQLKAIRNTMQYGYLDITSRLWKTLDVEIKGYAFLVAAEIGNVDFIKAHQSDPAFTSSVCLETFSKAIEARQFEVIQLLWDSVKSVSKKEKAFGHVISSKNWQILDDLWNRSATPFSFKYAALLKAENPTIFEKYISDFLENPGITPEIRQNLFEKLIKFRECIIFSDLIIKYLNKPEILPENLRQRIIATINHQFIISSYVQKRGQGYSFSHHSGMEEQWANPLITPESKQNIFKVMLENITILDLSERQREHMSRMGITYEERAEWGFIRKHINDPDISQDLINYAHSLATKYQRPL